MATVALRPRTRRGIGVVGFFLSLCCLTLGQFAPTHAQDTQDFIVQSFDADYYLSRDAQHISALRVKEKIVAEFPSYDQNHGILRAIPQTYQNHDVSLKIDTVTDVNGKKLPYTTSTANDNLVLKVGDANTYVHGAQEYDISYHMQNVTNKFDDHDELFWDVNGEQWQQPFGAVAARVHLSPDLAAALKPEQRCYTGLSGSTHSDCTITTEKKGSDTIVTFATSRSLVASETLSVVLGFSPGIFVGYQVPLSRVLWVAAGVIFLGLVPPALTYWVLMRHWRKFGRDAKGRGIIVPQYLPPKELSVLGGSEVLKQRFVPASISAQIIDLAVRHYIKIYETVEKRTLQKDKMIYQIELVRTTKGLKSEEKDVIAMLFGEDMSVGSRVDLSDLSTKLYKKAAALGERIDKQLASDGYFVRPPQKIFQTYLTWGIIMSVCGFIFPPYTLGLLLAGIVILVMSRLMPARTQKGVDTRDYLLGLRDYMKLAEADRIKALQSPRGELTEKIDVSDKTQLVKLYERLLPYAMLFGIEKEWAKEFADLYQQPPDWYVGSSAFNAVYFASAVHGFSSASAVSFTPPSSSSSSGFSGGSAGGGGGGGGGGGW